MYDNGEVKNIKDFNSSRVHSLAAEIESNFCVHTSSTETNDLIDTVLENFPVIYFSNKRNSVLVDLDELLFDKDCLSSLLTAKKAGKSRAVEQTPTVYGPKNKVGLRRLWQKFPQLIETASENFFLSRCLTSRKTGLKNGITLHEIRNHLLQNVPGLAAH